MSFSGSFSQYSVMSPSRLLDRAKSQLPRIMKQSGVFPVFTRFSRVSLYSSPAGT